MDGKNIWPTLAEGKASPHEDILISVEAFRGAIRKGNWKLVKVALLPGKTELFDLAKDPGETTNVADKHPEIVRDLEARLVAYAREQKPSEWIKAQPAFLGAQGKTVLDPDFDIDDAGLPHENSYRASEPRSGIAWPCSGRPLQAALEEQTRGPARALFSNCGRLRKLSYRCRAVLSGVGTPSTP